MTTEPAGQERVREITGRHVLAITLLAFGTIIAVNLTMLYFATSTFPGLEVKSPYVASQSFEARRAAQEALGWQASAQVAATSEGPGLRLSIRDASGAPVAIETPRLTLGRATHNREDLALDLTAAGNDWLARAPLEPGRWRLDLEASAADGTAYATRLWLDVPHEAVRGGTQGGAQ